MARLLNTTAAVALALAMASSVSSAQAASVSLTHTVVVTVPPRVNVQVAPTLNRVNELASGRTGIALDVHATRNWALVVGSKKGAQHVQWVSNSGKPISSMVFYRKQHSQRSPEVGGASDSEPMMLTVVAP